MGGGGANSLNSPETGEKQDILDDEKDSEVTSYEKRAFAQYLTDYEVPTTLAEIGKTTVTGNGSVESPYQINSTQDFVFFANLGMSNKYFELNCDIVYNDETFDENGTPSGGDGIFYEWRPISDCTAMNLDGKDNSFFGFYFNDSTYANSLGIFRGSQVEKIANLKLENVFIQGKERVSGLVGNVSYLENVFFKSGFVKGHRSVGLLAFNLYKFATNCENYASASSETEFCGGLVYQVVGAEVVNCRNYGSIYADSNAGGIAAIVSTNGKIFNCDNYGVVSVNKYHGGGIAGRANRATFEYCNNYATMISLTKYSVSGICGMAYGSINILNCNNYGQRKTDGNIRYKSQILGYVQIETKDTLVITIKGCGLYSNQEGGVMGEIHKASAYRPLLVVNIENCDIRYGGQNGSTVYVFLSPTYNKIELNIKNNIINIECETYFYSLFGDKWDDYLVTINIENLVVNTKLNNSLNDTKKKRLIIPKGTFSESTIVNVKNAVFNLNVNGSEEGIYFGNDFDDYCIDWKSGKMSLKAISGKGFFQGGVSEDMLIAKGYEKGVA